MSVKQKNTRQIGSTAGSVNRDEVFELLSSQRRRYALHLLQREGKVELGELAEHVAAWETGTAAGEVPADDRKNVYTSLQQFHLPKMDKKDVVDFDERQGCVEPGPQLEDLEVYLEVTEGREIPWSLYYLGLSVLNAGLALAMSVDAWLFRLIPFQSGAVFIVTTFLLSAAVHTYYTRTEMRLGKDGPPPEV